MVHHGHHHGDAAALEGQQLDSAQVGNGAVEAAGKRTGGRYSRRPSGTRALKPDVRKRGIAPTSFPVSRP